MARCGELLMKDRMTVIELLHAVCLQVKIPSSAAVLAEAARD